MAKTPHRKCVGRAGLAPPVNGGGGGKPNCAKLALNAANAQVANIISARDAERGSRIAGEGGDTTESLRKEVVTLLIDAIRQVNAAARVSENEYNAAAIQEVNGIIAHYKDVAAQPAKRKGGDEPEPEPEASAS